MTSNVTTSLVSRPIRCYPLLMYIDGPLEWVATFAVTCAIMAFVVVWDSQTPAGALLRHRTRLLGWAVLYMLKKPVGWGIGVCAAILAPFSEDIARYRNRRNWAPQH